MRTKSTFLIFFLTVVFRYYNISQNTGLPGKYRTDSLRRVLSFAKHDTDRIKLKYLIGLSSNIERTAYWDSIISSARKYNMPLYECRALAGLSYAYKTRNNNPMAVACLNKGIAIAGKKVYKAEMILLTRNLLSLYKNHADGRTLLDLCYKGLKMAREWDDKQAAVDFYSAIATHYFFVGDFNKALEMHFNCLKICKELNYNLGIASALTDIGSDYHALGNDKKTYEYYLASGKYAGEFSETIYGSYIYSSVASAYEIMQQPDSACKYAYKAYRIAERLNNGKRAMAPSLVVLAKALFQKGDLKGAEKTALEALHLSQSIGFTVQLADIALFLKRVYLKDQNYKKALEAYEFYVTTRDSISNEKNRKLALQREFAYSFEKKEKENTFLAQQIQIQLLQLNKNKYILTGFVALLLIVLIIGYLFFKQNKLKSEQQSVQLEQKLLRSQMNPHFIFNSLNSIQQFIISQQNGRAELYLAKFSRLIRELLESNIKESISVKEEAGILRGYLEMESLRFRKSFSFSITVDEKIDQERDTIPHMMIQPFVENAIWHGLLPKEGNRNLLVAFEADTDKTIRCIVDDNGVGRKKNMNKKNTFKKKSLALSFINQRILLMRKTLKVDCSVDIIDKTNDAGAGAGTRIVVVLPVLNK